MTPTIAIIDDHPLLAAALGAELARSGAQSELIDISGGADGIVGAVADMRPDLAAVDLRMPFAGGGQALIAPLVSLGIPVLVLTGEAESWLWAQALQAGAALVVSKAEPLGDIVEALVRVAAGESVRSSETATLRAKYEHKLRNQRASEDALGSLSRREQAVLAGLMAGQSVQRLAERDFVSVQTVRTQVKNLLRKLGAGSQLEAVALANAAGWQPDQEVV